MQEQEKLKELQEKLKDYHNKLITALNGNEPSYHFNSDREHNAIIMRVMLDNSSTLNMYCGEMSVFREMFYEHITKDNDDIKEYAEGIKTDLKNSFKEFIQKEDVSMNIIFETFKDDYLEDIIFDEDFKRGVSDKKINLYKLSDDFEYKEDIKHFTYTNCIVRFEQDKLRHSAICAINEQQAYYESIDKNFSLLKKMAIPIIVNA